MTLDMAPALDVDLYPVEGDHPSPAILVLPGGGFREHTAHDGEGYARWANTLGIAAVVLRYRLVPDPFPLALQQARNTLDDLQSGHLLQTSMRTRPASSDRAQEDCWLACSPPGPSCRSRIAPTRRHGRRSTSSPTGWQTSPSCLPPQSEHSWVTRWSSPRSCHRPGT